MHDVIILGSGPAGLTAALYASRAELKPLLIEGLEAGGQLMTTTDVENFPGFPEGVLGPEMMDLFKRQAERFGTEYVAGDATAVNLSGPPFQVEVGSDPYECRALIIATGAKARLLGLESERRLMGHGVSACATCDGFFFKGKKVMVVGGGDSAMEESTFLTRYATSVTVIHRRDELRASKIMQQRAFANEKIDFLWDSVVEDIRDVEQGQVTAVQVRNVKTDQTTEITCDGVFMAIGHDPNTKLFAGQLGLDEKGYIITHKGTHTSVPGVFACGDVQDARYRQAVTAAGTGCMAALDAQHYLEEQEG
jgi:thioredoxin reductase (NADPH)